MYLNENIKKIAKIFILAFLCNEMQSSLTQSNKEVAYEHTFHHANGTEASLATIKYHVSIRLKEMDSSYGQGHICSGAIIAPSVVLTTAQCIFNYNKNKLYHPAELKVVMGSVDRYERSDDNLIYGVTHCFQAPQFNSQSLRDNLAIIMLERDIDHDNENVKPITWYPMKSYNTSWYAKVTPKHYKMTSFMKTEEGVPLNQLMLLDIDLSSSESLCRHQYGLLYGKGMICMKLAKDLIVNDVGSPLILNNKLIGILSFNNEKADSIIFTDISYHSQWILDTIGDGTNQNSSIWGVLGFLILTVVCLRRSKFLKL